MKKKKYKVVKVKGGKIKTGKDGDIGFTLVKVRDK